MGREYNCGRFFSRRMSRTFHHLCATSTTIAILGAALAGLGHSLVFPALGKVAIRLLPDENGGVVLGAYLACFDWGLTIGGPVAGVIAHWRPRGFRWRLSRRSGRSRHPLGIPIQPTTRNTQSS